MSNEYNKWTDLGDTQKHYFISEGTNAPCTHAYVTMNNGEVERIKLETYTQATKEIVEITRKEVAYLNELIAISEKR